MKDDYELSPGKIKVSSSFDEPPGERLFLLGRGCGPRSPGALG